MQCHCSLMLTLIPVYPLLITKNMLRIITVNKIQNLPWIQKLKHSPSSEKRPVDVLTTILRGDIVWMHEHLPKVKISSVQDIWMVTLETKEIHVVDVFMKSKNQRSFRSPLWRNISTFPFSSSRKTTTFILLKLMGVVNWCHTHTVGAMAKLCKFSCLRWALVLLNVFYIVSAEWKTYPRLSLSLSTRSFPCA